MSDSWQSLLKILAIIVAGLSPVLAYKLGLLSLRRAHSRTTREVTDRLIVQLEPKHGAGYGLRVINQSNYPIKNLRAYITIENAPQDYLELRPAMPFINSGNIVPIIDNAIPWGKQPFSTEYDLFAGEQTLLFLFRTNREHIYRSIELCKALQSNTPYQEMDMIVVPSEKGYNQQGETPRAALEAKEYKMWVKLVSEDTTALAWEMMWSPIGKMFGLRKVSLEELSTRQDELRSKEMWD